MVQKLHTIKVNGLSTAFDICTLLDKFEDIIYTVNAHSVPDKFGSGHIEHIEYEIVYHYDIDGE